MSGSIHDSERSASDSARVDGENWRVPRHGHGRLRPWRKGETGRPPGVFSTRYSETVQLCREHSLEAVRTLVARLSDPDGRIAVVAAQALLERGWGKVREARPEEQQQMQLDLSSLNAAELALLVRLVNSEWFKAIPADAPGQETGAPVIEATSE